MHAPLAVKAGIAQSIVDSLWAGAEPHGLALDQQILYELCGALHRSHAVPRHLGALAVTALGEQGVVDAIAICGYYALLAMVLNSYPPAE